MSEPTVAAAILDALGAHDVPVAFGIPGVHNLPFWDADGPGRPRILGVRHEQAAGYAADGMYRATGRLGAALLTSGPGAANILAAFGEAYLSHSPMVVLASDVGTGLRHPGGPRGILHEMADQAAMFRAFGAWARNADSPAAAVGNTVLALRETLGPPARPVYCGVPSDILGMPWAGSVPGPIAAEPASVDPTPIAALAELIAASPRVAFWLGGGVVAAGVESEVRSLAHRLGAVVVTSFAGRGLLAGDSHLIDAPVHEPETAAVLRDADLLVVLGSSFDAMNTKNWRMDLPARRAALTLGEEISRTIDWDVLVQADLRAALPMLSEALDDQGVRPRQAWCPQAAGVRGAMFDRLRQDDRVRPALDLIVAVARAWSQDDAIVCDMAVAGFWVGLYSYHERPRRFSYPVGWGTLGYGLPAAIGPASLGISTLAVCGDGGPMFAIGELATLAQESLPVTLLVVDDGGYGMLRFDQQVFGHPERGVDLLTPDWVQLARSFGIAGEAATDIRQLEQALRAAAIANRRGEPRVIVWKQRLYPPRTTSPRWFEEAAS